MTPKELKSRRLKKACELQSFVDNSEGSELIPNEESLWIASLLLLTPKEMKSLRRKKAYELESFVEDSEGIEFTPNEESLKITSNYFVSFKHIDKSYN